MECRCLFFTSAIFRGSIFSDRNAKMGPDGARVHLESSNLVCRYIFRKYYEVCFIDVGLSPCTGVVYLVTETQKWALRELECAWSAQIVIFDGPLHR